MLYRDESTVQSQDGRLQEPWTEDSAQIERRFAQARAAGRPAWLWPEIAEGEWRRALRALERVVRAVLQARRAPRLTGPPVSLCLAGYTSGLGPWLGRQIEDGTVDADEAVAGVFAAHLDHSRRRWAKLEAALAAAVRALETAGVSAGVVKGAVTAHRCFVEPSLRPMADLDVVVAAAVLNEAGAALAAAGFAEVAAGRLIRPPRRQYHVPGTAVRLHSVMLVHADDPISVDLHGGLAIDFFGVRTLDFGEPGVWPRPERAPATPPPVVLAAHHAVHASCGLHALTLLRQLELVLLLRTVRADDLLDLLHDVDGGRFAFPALQLAERLAPGTVEQPLLAYCRAAAPPRLRRVVDRLSPATAQRIGRTALEERFMWGASPAEHLRRLRTMLIPPGEALGPLYSGRLRRIVQRQVGWRGGREA